MMKKRLSFVLIALGLASVAYAQKGSTPLWTVAASGGTAKIEGNIELSWTVGQPVTESVTKNGFMLTQGFQQGTITFVEQAENKTGINELQYTEAAKRLDVSLFPNPTKSAFNVMLASTETNEAVRTIIEIVDVGGRLVRSEVAMIIPGQPYTISVEPLQPGMYMVLLRSAEKSRVVKMMKE